MKIKKLIGKIGAAYSPYNRENQYHVLAMLSDDTYNVITVYNKAKTSYYRDSETGYKIRVDISNLPDIKVANMRLWYDGWSVIRFIKINETNYMAIDLLEKYSRAELKEMLPSECKWM